MLSYPYPCELYQAGCIISSCDGLASVPDIPYPKDDDTIVYYPRCYKQQTPQFLSEISEAEFARAKRGEFQRQDTAHKDQPAAREIPSDNSSTAAEGFTSADRKLLRQIHRATVYNETPTDAQLAGDVRREQVAYGLRFYKPSTRYVKGVSFVQAARKAICAPQFVRAEGAYSLGELKTLAKAIERAYNQGDSAT